MDAPRIALLYPGDRAARDRADPAASRFAALFAAFAEAGIPADPAVWHDDFAAEVRAQLLDERIAGVLVWCNPIEGGRRRDALDALLREAAAGVTRFVSAHPDAVLALGTKDVLVATREAPFGSDTRRIDSLDDLRAGLPARLAAGARVLKQHRGHSGIGVWRVAYANDTRRLLVRHAERGSAEEVLDLEALCARLAPYFVPEAGGHMIDQPWQAGIAGGMLRAYLVGHRVAGFGHQALNALLPAAPGEGAAPAPGPRLYHDAAYPPAQELRSRLEGGWIDTLLAAVKLTPEHVPLLWDCDFIPGHAPGRWVLCEVNVSSVSPFPPSAIAPLVAAVQARLASR